MSDDILAEARESVKKWDQTYPNRTSNRLMRDILKDLADAYEKLQNEKT